MKIITLKLVLEHLAENGEDDADVELEVVYTNQKPEAVIRFSSYDPNAPGGKGKLFTIWPTQTDEQVLWNLRIKSPKY